MSVGGFGFTPPTHLTAICVNSIIIIKPTNIFPSDIYIYDYLKWFEVVTIPFDTNELAHWMVKKIQETTELLHKISKYFIFYINNHISIIKDLCICVS